MGFELFIADRYLRSKRRTGFISIITYISAAGVMIGVAALVIVLSVANGFESEVRSRIIGADAHIKLTLFHQEPMEDYNSVRETTLSIPHVTGGSPFISGKGMLWHGKAVEGALIKGIDEKTVGQVSDLPATIVAGRLKVEPDSTLSLQGNIAPEESGEHGDVSSDEFSRPKFSKLPGIILGRQLSFRLGASIGDSVIAISPKGMTGLFSSPLVKRFIVTGIFETGIFEYDDTYSYISIQSAQEIFLSKNAVSGIEFKLDDIENTEAVKYDIENNLGYPYYVQSWHDMHRTLFRWMKLEKWLYTILLSLIILVAGFNIISSQIMVVMEKRREIGILKAIGASKESIMKIFLYQGLIVGVIGTAFGLLLGWAVCYGQKTYNWISLPGDVYFLNTLPVQMQGLDFVIITIVSLSLTVLATVYPAKKAGSMDPVEAIRYE